MYGIGYGTPRPRHACREFDIHVFLERAALRRAYGTQEAHPSTPAHTCQHSSHASEVKRMISPRWLRLAATCSIAPGCARSIPRRSGGVMPTLRCNIQRARCAGQTSNGQHRTAKHRTYVATYEIAFYYRSKNATENATENTHPAGLAAHGRLRPIPSKAKATATHHAGLPSHYNYSSALIFGQAPAACRQSSRESR